MKLFCADMSKASKEEVTVELFEAAVPVALTVRADQVRVTQRVE